MKLSIVVAASSGYLYVWRSLVRRIVAAARHRDQVHFCFVSDASKECSAAFKLLKSELPSGWETEQCIVPIEFDQGDEKFTTKNKLLIARLHNEGFAAARRARADQCWTLEPDVLPPGDALRLMEWALTMPQLDGSPYYDVAFCTYPNGGFIGGRGDPAHPIAENVTPEERDLSPEIKERHDRYREEEKQFVADRKMPDAAWQQKGRELRSEIEQCPPKGNVWKLNAEHGWRPRGWLDYAYPGIGRGALLPSDWAGEGCNLLSGKALATAYFEGYDGGSTQDLFLCWRKYHPNDIRIACITHAVCDHVKKQPDGKLIHLQALHEQLGESRGHLRVLSKEWQEV